LDAAATLLVEIAGPDPVHIEMSNRGPAKYYEVKRALGISDARTHLTGKQTKGATLNRPDDKTRALCYDADTDDDWQRLQEAAHFLANAGGYLPLVEDSPDGRGGHLWVIYTALVDARCAHCHVCELAPMLTAITERWPGPGNHKVKHKVRLPGGKYVKPGFSQQCKLSDAIGTLVADTRQDAARALLTYQTSAAIVPAYPPDADLPGNRHVSTSNLEPGVSDQLSGDEMARSTQQNQGPALPREPDARWQQTYQSQGKHLWFQFTPAQLAAWYNQQHAIGDVLPPEQNGMGLATWRGERTTSVGSTKDSQGWVDFGASARRSDGKQDGGDALELQVRLSEQSKSEVMRQAARDLVKEARAALESSARAGEQLLTWVQEILTPAGWHHYQQLRDPASESHVSTIDQAPAIVADQAQLSPVVGAPTRATGG
jgi:hypothetical protein